ncbi:MAG TPA: orotidine-5'-phosphate decarboxylase [Candidatus Limnocylindrales bacterium]|nr:orotidine-5'-phosphate decarboxylase [Candidatus Limnocylindrales bacterium]
MAEVIVALDVPSADDARALVRRIGDRGDFYKVGLELYTRAGPDFVRELTTAGKRVFLDLKLHDIPNTVASAVRAASDLGVDLLTVHAVGGPSMLAAAVEVADAGSSALRLLAVTVLTSLDAEELGGVWGRPTVSVPDEVRRLTDLVVRAHVHGVVCSAVEAAHVRSAAPPGLVIVTPGIRPAGADVGDQKRVATPAAAVRAGADYLVLGRAVTRAPDPAVALSNVLAEIEASHETS